jgi:hypothetical protein
MVNLTFNTDMSQAPKGKTVKTVRKVKTADGLIDKEVTETVKQTILVVSPEGNVVFSHWVEPRYTETDYRLKGDCWAGFSPERPPLAWALPVVSVAELKASAPINPDHIPVLDDVGGQ